MKGIYVNRISELRIGELVVARALEEEGREYVLPIRVDDTELLGMPPPIGHLHISMRIDKIAEPPNREAEARTILSKAFRGELQFVPTDTYGKCSAWISCSEVRRGICEGQAATI